MAYQIDLQIDPAASPDLPPELAPECLQRLMAHVFQRLCQPPKAEASLLITSDAQIRELNRAYRATDAPTDVLAFSAREGQEFITPPDLPPYLGDVVISLPTAKQQAAERNRPVQEELGLLIVHGCLHLVGYDHATPEEQSVMWRLQEDILRELGIEPPELDHDLSEDSS